MEPVTLTIADACKAIGCGRTLIYEMIADKRLDSITLGRRRLVTTASIRRLVANAAEREDA